MKTIALNIMMSYPVKWKKEQVLRDIVQNFYDDAGADGFGKNFKKEYLANEGKLILSLVSAGFSYEWLLHMGASTKQEQSGKYAGFFGEGFKVASLCALRDYEWKIKMRSQNWSIEVCSLETYIDGKTLKQLAYSVEDELEDSPETILAIENFTKEDAGLLECVVLGFYYPENPLIGKLIFKNEYAAIHERSEVPKPKHFAFSFGMHGDGIIFIGFQARGEFVRPLVICNHRFKTPDRERNNIFRGTVMDTLLDLADLIDVKTACYLLEQLEKYWYDYPGKKDDMDSWYSLIRKLIRKIAFYDFRSTVSDEFMSRHPHLVVCERPTNTDTRNKKTQALAWKGLYLPDSRLVQDGFLLLGYKTIVNLCMEAGGFNKARLANVEEQQLFKILENAANDILGDFIKDYPACFVIENESSVYNGTANIIKNKTVIYNNHGYRIRYTLANIEIKGALLAKDKFMEALSTYCHELCHCFGGDASAAFSRALTHVIILIMENTEKMSISHRLWVEQFDSMVDGNKWDN
ncbi:MAG: hypothetical protein LBB91_07850 [Clostridiales bacterium]|jgi:hypothetical protein|nr:hypothetical protein [Clostridiales bacterium]